MKTFTPFFTAYSKCSGRNAGRREKRHVARRKTIDRFLVGVETEESPFDDDVGLLLELLGCIFQAALEPCVE